MNKRHLHHLYTLLRPIRLRYLLVAFLVCLAVMILALRNNNLQMVHLKQAVYTADKDGGDTAKALQNLQHYVTGHMNTDLSAGDGIYPPIQLKYTYDRLVTTESEKLATTNQQLYNDAQKYCETQNSTDVSGRNRIPCIQQYVKDHGQPLQTIPDSLYKFDFVSPYWSPDLAGWAVVATVLSGLVLLTVSSLRLWFKNASK